MTFVPDSEVQRWHDTYRGKYGEAIVVTHEFDQEPPPRRGWRRFQPVGGGALKKRRRFSHLDPSQINPVEKALDYWRQLQDDVEHLRAN